MQRSSIKKDTHMRRVSSINESNNKFQHSEAVKSEISPEEALKALLEEELKIDQQIDEEIEAFIEKTNIEMNKEQEDIRKSYEEDIRGFEGRF